VTPADVANRIERLRLQPDFVKYSSRDVEVYGLTREPGRMDRYTDLVVVVHDPERSYGAVDPEVWHKDVAEAEWHLIGAALQRPASLEQVNSYSSAVAETLAANAVIAVILSLLGILVYVWVRFGSLWYSTAAIMALAHNVMLCLGLLAISALVARTALGALLGVEPFRINLEVIAALLTIIGYSLNDTIVILDRIRENRGKLPRPTAKIVNDSINQTFSRTMLTGFATIVAVIILYVEGGPGLRPFAFCLFFGLVIGTYSSVAIAAPLVFTGKGGAEPAPADSAVPARAAEPRERSAVAS
jgi:SecD/SecF fusion protein